MYYLFHRIFIRKNITSFAIILFLCAFAVINYYKPAILYEENGKIRDFGLGTKKKTILPIWLVTIMIAILSYWFILWYLNSHKFSK